MRNLGGEVCAKFFIWIINLKDVLITTTDLVEL